MPQTANALVELQKVYANDNGNKRTRETSSEKQSRPEGTKRPREKRHLKGLDRSPLDLRKMINGTRVDISLAELFDIAPAARVEFAKLMRLAPAEKERKRPKRVRVSHIEHAADEVYDDCFQPRDPRLIDLFYTNVVI